MDEDTREFESRALAAEDELSALRFCLREFQQWLGQPTRGPVIYRREVIERLDKIAAL